MISPKELSLSLEELSSSNEKISSSLLVTSVSKGSSYKNEVSSELSSCEGTTESMKAAAE